MPRQKKCRHRVDGEKYLLTFLFIGRFYDGHVSCFPGGYRVCLEGRVVIRPLANLWRPKGNRTHRSTLVVTQNRKVLVSIPTAVDGRNHVLNQCGVQAGPDHFSRQNVLFVETDKYAEGPRPFAPLKFHRTLRQTALARTRHFLALLWNRSRR